MAKDKGKKKDATPEEVEPVKAKKDKGEKAGKAAKPSGPKGVTIEEPTSADQFAPKDHNGKLLLIWPNSFEEGVETKHGAADAIRADIVVINEKKPEKSENISDGLIFQRVLISNLRGALSRNTVVLGRLTLDTSGENDTWRLGAPTGADKEAAQAYLASTNPIEGAR